MTSPRRNPTRPAIPFTPTKVNGDGVVAAVVVVDGGRRDGGGVGINLMSVCLLLVNKGL